MPLVCVPHSPQVWHNMYKTYLYLPLHHVLKQCFMNQSTYTPKQSCKHILYCIWTFIHLFYSSSRVFFFCKTIPFAWRETAGWPACKNDKISHQHAHNIIHLPTYQTNMHSCAAKFLYIYYIPIQNTMA